MCFFPFTFQLKCLNVYVLSPNLLKHENLHILPNCVSKNECGMQHHRSCVTNHKQAVFLLTPSQKIASKTFSPQHHSQNNFEQLPKIACKIMSETHWKAIWRWKEDPRTKQAILWEVKHGGAVSSSTRQYQGFTSGDSTSPINKFLSVKTRLNNAPPFLCQGDFPRSRVPVADHPSTNQSYLGKL